MQDRDLSKLLGSASLVLIGSIIGSSSMLVERAIIARLASTDAYGEFSLALSIFAISATLGAAGFQQGVARFMPRFNLERDIRGVLVSGLIVTLAISISLSIILLIARGSEIVGRLFQSNDTTILYQLFVVSIPVYVLFQIGVSGIRGLENTRYKIISQNLLYPLLRMVIIASLLLSGIGIFATGIGYITSLIISTIMVYFLLNKLLPLRGKFTLHVPKMVIFSVPLVFSNILNMLLTHTDTLMLGHFQTTREVGIYNAAYPLAVSMTVLLSAFGYMYLPLASRLDKEGEDIARIYQITTKWLLLMAVPVFITIVTFPGFIIGLVFGDSYSVGENALVILTIGFFINAAVGRNRETLSALGATRAVLLSNIVAFGMNLFLNIIFIPLYGYHGAAFASALSYITLTIVVYYLLKFKFDITPYNKNSMKIFFSIALVISPMSILTNIFVDGSVVLVGLFSIIVGVILIISIAILNGFEPEDLIIIQFVEEKMGIEIPIIRSYIPEDK